MEALRRSLSVRIWGRCSTWKCKGDVPVPRYKMNKIKVHYHRGAQGDRWKLVRLETQAGARTQSTDLMSLVVLGVHGGFQEGSGWTGFWDFDRSSWSQG